MKPEILEEFKADRVATSLKYNLNHWHYAFRDDFLAMVEEPTGTASDGGGAQRHLTGPG